MHTRKFLVFLWCLFPFLLKAQTASFIAPDTVCVGSPVQLQNTSTGASNYFWNFCSGGVYITPTVTSLGNPGNYLKDPVFVAHAKDGNNYYVFVINNTDDRLVRLDFGTSLQNPSPVATVLSNIAVPPSAEGIQLVKDANGWHAIIVGGTVANGSRIVKIDFGASLANNNPTAVNWGNIGQLAYPTDLYVFEQGGSYYGFTVNFESSTITRFNFGTSFTNPPTAVNLGNFGGSLSAPTGIFAIQENNDWYLMITNQANSTITRIGFGNSLLNPAPVAQNLGNPGNVLDNPRDISFISECGVTSAIVVGQPNAGRLSRLVFNDGAGGNNITGTDLGHGNGMLAFPHAISTVFREGNSLHAFIPNVRTGTLAKVTFTSCQVSSIANSTLATPPVYSYRQPGIYTVKLITDEGLPTQRTVCKNIVVMVEPVVNFATLPPVCNGGTVQLSAPPIDVRYLWSTGETTRDITVSTSGNYSVTVSNGGCSASGSVDVRISPLMAVTAASLQDIDCSNATGETEIQVAGGTAPFRYELDGAAGVTQPLFTGLTEGDHNVVVTDDAGCATVVNFSVVKDPARSLEATANITPLRCWNVSDGEVELQVAIGVPPFEFAGEDRNFQAQPLFGGLDAGTYKFYVRNNYCLDSVIINVPSPPALIASAVLQPETCGDANGRVTLQASGGTGPYTYVWDGTPSASPVITGLSAGIYPWRVTDANGCFVTRDTALTNLQLGIVRIINNDTTINIGESITLYAQGGRDYQWEPLEGSLSCLDCPAPVARPLIPTQYIVRVPPGTACKEADTVNIQITYFNSFFMPNAFTPNGDGQNDFFRPKARGLLAYVMLVYDRWGGLVFQGDLNGNGWDGTKNGQPMPMGTYVYTVNFVMFDELGNMKPDTRKGTFTLIR